MNATNVFKANTLTISSRATHTSLGDTPATTLPASVATNPSQNVCGNSNSNTTIVLPIAKVLPQQLGHTQRTITNCVGWSISEW